MNIYVGNLSSQVSDDDLRAAFQPFGEITRVTVIKDKWSGESKGFAFVEMAKKEEGQSAIDGLNGKELQGKSIVVNEARPKTERSGGGRGRGKGSFGGGRRDGGSGGGGRGRRF
ncbi:MAG: RNA-binding protein [Bacteroidota bacterium]|nr:RNA-binding protein [Bacteroidota bacterium]